MTPAYYENGQLTYTGNNDVLDISTLTLDSDNCGDTEKLLVTTFVFKNVTRIIREYLPNYTLNNIFPNITTIVLPEGLIEIGSHVFQQMGKLIDVNLPASLTIIGGYCFMNCSSLK